MKKLLFVAIALAAAAYFGAVETGLVPTKHDASSTDRERR